MKKLIRYGLAALTILWSCIAMLPTQAAITPDYEVKFLLDSQRVLDETHCLNTQSQSFFHVQDAPSEVQVQYVDTLHHDFSQAGWTQRMRHKEGKNKLEITYKKRYAIVNGDTASALQQAAQDGFSQTDTPYKAQIDWGYRNMTLSLSYTKKIPGYDALPTAAQAKRIAAAHMPAEELKTISLATEGRIYGPLTYQKYAGMLAGQAVDIEIWPVPNTSEYIAELSFKAPTYTDAVKKRKQIQHILEARQIVKAEDSLKTTKIVNAASNS